MMYWNTPFIYQANVVGCMNWCRPISTVRDDDAHHGTTLLLMIHDRGIDKSVSGV